MNLLQEEIDHFGDRIDQSIKISGQEIDARIDQVGAKLEDAIGKVSREFSAQRRLTKDDIEYLIRYATLQIGGVLDERINKLKRYVFAVLGVCIVLVLLNNIQQLRTLVGALT